MVERRTGWLEGVVRRRYERHRRRYLTWQSIVFWVMHQVTFQSSIPAFGLILGLDRTAMFRASLIVAAQALLAPLQLLVSHRVAATHVVRMLRGQDYDPHTAWRQALRSNRQTTQLVSVFISLSMMTVPIVTPENPMETDAVVAWWAYVLVTSIFTQPLFYTGSRVMMRPVLDEISRRNPEVVGTTRTSSVSTMLTWSVGTSVMGGVMFTGALTVLVDATTSRLWTLTAVTLFGSAYAMVLFRLFYGSPAVAPLVELRQAAEDVAVGDVHATVSVASGDEFGQLASAFNQMTAGLRERAKLQSAFGSYVDPALAQRLLDSDDHLFHGELVEVTVMFIDVRGFTSYTSRHEASDVVARLNRLFEHVVPILRQHSGHANKFLGDGVLAVFGTPEELDNHADRALAAATDILDEVQRVFGDDLKIGIGIDTGKVIAGTLGGGGKLEFTVIGDTVNTAARVEARTKELGYPLVITGNTLAALQKNPVYDHLGSELLRGRAEAIDLWGHRPD